MAVQVPLVVFCPREIHVDPNESEDNRRVCSCPQVISSLSVIVSMKPQIEVIDTYRKVNPSDTKFMIT